MSTTEHRSLREIAKEVTAQQFPFQNEEFQLARIYYGAGFIDAITAVRDGHPEARYHASWPTEESAAPELMPTLPACMTLDLLREMLTDPDSDWEQFFIQSCIEEVELLLAKLDAPPPKPGPYSPEDPYMALALGVMDARRNRPPASGPAVVAAEPSVRRIRDYLAEHIEIKEQSNA